jgi:glycosyltransferase involved in cell wall biosynthesis
VSNISVSNKVPRVSIGLPVYNGENFLKEALDSILAQTFTDFELVISDNASTDRTEDLCREYAACDKRIRYSRNPENLGAGWNNNRVCEISTGEYFKWWAHDDLCAPEFLERCVAVLDRDPSVVLCHSKVTVIDGQGSFVEHFDGYNRLALSQRKLMTKLGSSKPHERFGELATPHMCYQIFGVIRSNALKTTPLLGFYSAADNVLLARLGLIGRFYEVPEYLFYARNHPQQSTHVCNDHDKYAEWWDPKNRNRRNLPEIKIFLEYLDAINSSELPWIQKFYCYGYLLPALRRARKPMLKELVLEGRKLLAQSMSTSTNSQRA